MTNENKMRIVLKGYSNDTKRLVDLLSHENTFASVVAITDRDSELIGECVTYRDTQIPIIHVFEACELVKNGKADGVVIPSGMISPLSVRARANELVSGGFDYEDIYVAPVELVMGNTIENISFIKYTEYSYLDHLEFHITNKCNLNCRGCDHYVPIIPEENEVNYYQLKEDINQLKQKVDHIRDILILGGEPLLSNHLLDCVYFVREAYPFARILIVTNGILVPKLSNDLINAIKECGVQLMITQYYSISSIYKEVFRFCKSAGLKVVTDSHITRYFKKSLLSTEKVREYEGTILPNYGGCGCVTLEKGKLYACSTLAFTHYYNERFDTNYPVNESDGIDIYDESISGFEMYRFIKKPKPMCAYCYSGRTSIVDVPDYFKAGEVIECKHTDNPRRDDWIINE